MSTPPILPRLSFYLRVLVWLELHEAYWRVRAHLKNLLLQIFPRSFLFSLKHRWFYGHTISAVARAHAAGESPQQSLPLPPTEVLTEDAPATIPLTDSLITDSLSVLRHTDYPNCEIIVVDNASADATPQYLRELATCYANVRLLLNEENHGFAKANNQGLALATGDYLVLLNNDTVVPPGWLSRLLWHLRDPAIGLVGPMTNAVGNEAKVDVHYRTWPQMEDFAHAHTFAHDRQIGDIQMLAMYCVALRRGVWQELGALDEGFGLGMFEDDDYTMRARQHGYRVICARDVFIHHFGQAAFKSLIEDGSYHPLFERNRSLYETKWKTTWTPHVYGSLNWQEHVLNAATGNIND
jgi:GT2 family glycosyltransferase